MFVHCITKQNLGGKMKKMFSLLFFLCWMVFLVASVSSESLNPDTTGTVLSWIAHPKAKYYSLNCSSSNGEIYKEIYFGEETSFNINDFLSDKKDGMYVFEVVSYNRCGNFDDGRFVSSIKHYRTNTMGISIVYLHEQIKDFLTLSSLV